MSVWLWPLVVGALVIQETATLTAVIAIALQNGFPAWIIHILWAGITLCDMYIGFAGGSFLKRRYRDTRIMRRIDAYAEKLQEPLGKYGKRLFIIALGIILFPYVVTFIAAWLGISRKQSILYAFIANAIWYALIWIALLGAGAFFKDPTALIFAAIVAIVLAELAGKRYVERRMRGR